MSALDRSRLSRWMVQVPREEWPQGPDLIAKRIAVWASRDFLCVVATLDAHPGVLWLSINRTRRALGRWRDGISWDELMQVKRECGYGEAFAVECYPEDSQVVNVANLRHLFVMPERLPFAWKNAAEAAFARALEGEK